MITGAGTPPEHPLKFLKTPRGLLRLVWILDSLEQAEKMNHVAGDVSKQFRSSVGRTKKQVLTWLQSGAVFLGSPAGGPTSETSSPAAKKRKLDGGTGAPSAAEKPPPKKNIESTLLAPGQVLAVLAGFFERRPPHLFRLWSSIEHPSAGAQIAFRDFRHLDRGYTTSAFLSDLIKERMEGETKLVQEQIKEWGGDEDDIDASSEEDSSDSSSSNEEIPRKRKTTRKEGHVVQEEGVVGATCSEEEEEEGAEDAEEEQALKTAQMFLRNELRLRGQGAAVSAVDKEIRKKMEAEKTVDFEDFDSEDEDLL